LGRSINLYPSQQYICLKLRGIVGEFGIGEPGASKASRRITAKLNTDRVTDRVKFRRRLANELWLFALGSLEVRHIKGFSEGDNFTFWMYITIILEPLVLRFIRPKQIR